MTMTENPMNGPPAPTRRSLVQAAIGVVGTAAAIAIRPATAAPTISKAAVGYQDQPQDDKECDRCLQFLAPSSCKVVEGTISPHGFCRIFASAG
jgi:hypothetical protein